VDGNLKFGAVRFRGEFKSCFHETLLLPI
jgi:hypothetical protein